MEEGIERVRATLLSKKPSYQTTDKKEVRVRCPYCGDSMKDPSAAHFYVAMTPPFKFHCFKCLTSGVLNASVLSDLMLFDNETNLVIIDENKKARSMNEVSYVSYKQKKLINPAVNTLASQNAVNYFNNRFGTNYSNEEIVTNFKAVTDAEEFFKANNLHISRTQYQFQNSIGFISSDNSHVIFRDITGQQSKRYFNLNLAKNENNNTVISKTYNIRSNLNAMNDEVNLIITEGIFDIIGVFAHVYNSQLSENTIFAAACGKAFNAVISNYIKKSFLNLNIIIFSDGDVDLNFYKELKRNNPYLKNSNLTIYYNQLEKDYGIRKENIRLTKIQL